VDLKSSNFGYPFMTSCTKDLKTWTHAGAWSTSQQAGETAGGEPFAPAEPLVVSLPDVSHHVNKNRYLSQ
jgi:hypothetical protein